MTARQNEMQVKVSRKLEPSSKTTQTDLGQYTQLKDAHVEVDKLRKEIVDCKREIDERERLLAEVRKDGVDAVSAVATSTSIAIELMVRDDSYVVRAGTQIEGDGDEIQRYQARAE